MVHLNEGWNYMRDAVEIGTVWREYEIYLRSRELPALEILALPDKRRYI
jgi:hypothetical protein